MKINFRKIVILLLILSYPLSASAHIETSTSSERVVEEATPIGEEVHIHRESNILAVEIFDKTKEELRYGVTSKHTGKLFLLFPVEFTVVTQVVINNNNSISIKSGPVWWSMFVTGTTYNQQEIENNLKKNLELSQLLQENVELNENLKIEIAELISKIVELQN